MSYHSLEIVYVHRVACTNLNNLIGSLSNFLHLNLKQSRFVYICAFASFSPRPYIHENYLPKLKLALPVDPVDLIALGESVVI